LKFEEEHEVTRYYTALISFCSWFLENRNYSICLLLFRIVWFLRCV